MPRDTIDYGMLYTDMLIQSLREKRAVRAAFTGRSMEPTLSEGMQILDEETPPEKIKLADKGQNLERLGRHLKLFTDKSEVAGPDGGPIPVANLTAADLSDDQIASILLRDK